MKSIENAFQLEREAFEQRFAGNFTRVVENFDGRVGAVDADLLLNRIDRQAELRAV